MTSTFLMPISSRHHALQHLAFGFQGLQRSGAALQQAAPASGSDLQGLAQLEGVVVGDDDVGARDVAAACRGGTISRLA